MASPGGSPLTVILAAPSGCGKNFTQRSLSASDPDFVAGAPSVTTRLPRPGEVDGVDYRFIDRDSFMADVAAGKFAEWNEVGGSLYGTLLSDLQVSDGYQILIKDPVGAVELAKIMEDRGQPVMTVFMSSDPDSLTARLEGRNAENLRVAMARGASADELEQIAVAHAKRVSQVGWEQENWSRRVESGELPFDLVFPDFGPGNSDQVIAKIAEFARLRSLLSSLDVARMILIVTGPSASGKTHFATEMVNSGAYSNIISTTTRAMRPGEVDGTHYHFITEDEFDRRTAEGRFVESVEYDGRRYAIDMRDLEDAFASRRVPLVVAEPSGAQQIIDHAARNGYSTVRIFLNNPEDVLRDRMLNERLHKEIRDLDPDKPEDRQRIDQLTAVVRKRIENISTVEQEGWVRPAYSGEHRYDRVFDTYGRDNSIGVAAEVAKLVRSSLSNSIACSLRKARTFTN